MFDTHKGMCQLSSADILLFKSSLGSENLKRTSQVLDEESIIGPNGVHVLDLNLEREEKAEAVGKSIIKNDMSTQEVYNQRYTLEKYDASRAFTIWTSVKLMGLDDLLRQTVDKNLILARHLNEELSIIPGVVTIPPEMSFVCFRLEMDGGVVSSLPSKHIYPMISRCWQYFSRLGLQG